MMPKPTLSFFETFVPLGFFLLTLLYGLFAHPYLMGTDRLSLEILVLISLTFSTIFLLFKGFSWEHIQEHISAKVKESIPVVMILFCIGVLIGSWIVSGTIPMLIYYGISIVSPDWIYIWAFLICIVFSMLTGTSWGSAGTIGIVMMGIAQVYQADLVITAAAIVGGSFFGDKMSPLSDTTNIASLATKVHIYDHIKSMMYTTGPSAVIALLAYAFLSYSFQGTMSSAPPLDSISATLTDLDKLFDFNILLLLPLVLVFWGSMTKKPIILTLLGSSWVAVVLALIFQPYSLSDIFQTCNKGFSVAMSGIEMEAASPVLNILNRGGLYNLIDGIVISLLVFAFIGTLDVVQAIPKTIDRVFSGIKKSTHLVAASLGTTFFTNMTTSNQYATSFIIGAAFGKKYDEMGVERKVLSRSIEDAGTMMENLLPWTPSGIFMAQTLGVSSLEYGPWQFLSLANIVIAFFFAFTGIACFKRVVKV